MSYSIIDTVTKEVVAQRATLAAARKKAQALNVGLVGRYTVSTLAIKG